MRKPFTVTRSQARELRAISERMNREGGVSVEVIRRDMLEDMATELRRMTKAYVRSRKGGAELLDCLAIAELEGVDKQVLKEIRREIAQAARRRRKAA